MQKPTLSKWLEKAARSERNHLTVPPHIYILPCGCVRTDKEPAFSIRLVLGSGWFHHSNVCCRETHKIYPHGAVVSGNTYALSIKEKAYAWRASNWEGF